MDSDTLKNVLITFAVDVLVEARARLGNVIKDHLRKVLERERRFQEGEARLIPDAQKPKGRFMDMKQAGEYMGMSAAAFGRMIERHPLPPGVMLRLGRRRRIDIYAFEKWLLSQSKAPRP